MIVANNKTRMGANGRVVIPAEIRRELDLAPGEELVARREGRRVLLERPQDLLESIQREWGDAAGDGSPVDQLIAERRREAEREEREQKKWKKSRSSTRQR